MTLKWLHPHGVATLAAVLVTAIVTAAFMEDIAPVAVGALILLGYFASDRLYWRIVRGDWLYQPSLEYPGFPPQTDVEVGGEIE